MSRRLGALSIIVRDYDEAIVWYRDRLGFELIEDTRLSGQKRWVVMRPGAGGSDLVLARAATDAQSAHVGAQGGGRVWLFLETDDFERDYRAMTAAGVQFEEAPRQEPYGTVAVFLDLYGNRWDLLQRR